MCEYAHDSSAYTQYQNKIPSRTNKISKTEGNISAELFNKGGSLCCKRKALTKRSIRVFTGQSPKIYNIEVDVCDKWEDERYRLALIYEDEGGTGRKIHFLGPQEPFQPPGQRTAGAWNHPGRSRWYPVAAVPRDGDHPYCRL